MDRSTTTKGILVSDFDGTLARHDFFRLVIERLLPDTVPDYWQQYRTGQITHFEAMRLYYSSIRATEAETLRIAESLELVPNLAEWLRRLEQVNWKVIVASAGCEWYIRYLLGQQKVEMEVHANPGQFVEGQGLLMRLPIDSPYYSPTTGIDKAAIVRAAQQTSPRVAFAGDGYPHIAAARLVPAGLRFATAALATALQDEGLSFRYFQRWTDVATALVNDADFPTISA